jgi:hypothetical protein
MVGRGLPGTTQVKWAQMKPRSFFRETSKVSVPSATSFLQIRQVNRLAARPLDVGAAIGMQV